MFFKNILFYCTHTGTQTPITTTTKTKQKIKTKANQPNKQTNEVKVHLKITQKSFNVGFQRQKKNFLNSSLTTRFIVYVVLKIFQGFIFIERFLHLLILYVFFIQTVSHSSCLIFLICEIK